MVTKENMMFRSIVMLALIATISGCEVLHSDTREKQVTTLRQNYSKIPLAQQIEVPRKNRKDMLDKQLAIIDELAKVRVEGAIAAVVVAENSATVKDRLDMVVDRMGAKNLTVTPEGIKDIRDRQEEIASSEDQLSRISNDYSMSGLRPRGCSDLTTEEYKKLIQWASDSPNAKGAAVVSASHPFIVEYCGQIAAARKKIAGYNVGELEALSAQLSEEKHHLNQLQSASNIETENFKKLLKQINVGSKGKDATSLAPDAAKLKEYLQTLEKSQNPFTIQLISKEKAKSIEDFLSTISSYKPGEAPPPDSPRAALAVLFFTEIFRIIGSADGGNKDVDWNPLVMQKKIEKARLDAANREIDVLTKKIFLTEEEYKLRFLQVSRFSQVAEMRKKYLVRVHNLPMPYALGIEPLPKAHKSRKGDKQSFIESDLPSNEERINIHRAIAYSIDAGVILDAEVQKIKLKKVALDSETPLSYSESAVDQWAALVDTNITSLETTYKLNFTSKQINDVINSIIFLWIGKGVNKK